MVGQIAKSNPRILEYIVCLCCVEMGRRKVGVRCDASISLFHQEEQIWREKLENAREGASKQEDNLKNSDIFRLIVDSNASPAGM
jgi:hypothetical protein